MPRNNSRNQSDPNLDLIRIIEEHKSGRVRMVCATIVLCVFAMVGGYVETHKEPWEAIIAALIAPGGTLAWFLRYHLKTVHKLHGRIRDLEAMADPNRTSSDPKSFISAPTANVNAGTTLPDDSGAQHSGSD
jgi:hypothetical protein